jgi:hypothetical protein
MTKTVRRISFLLTAVDPIGHGALAHPESMEKAPTSRQMNVSLCGKPGTEMYKKKTTVKSTLAMAAGTSCHDVRRKEGRGRIRVNGRPRKSQNSLYRAVEASENSRAIRFFRYRSRKKVERSVGRVGIFAIGK